ncbi:MAG: hypothetical protein AAFV53_24470 [Myxococcota bacterium]
MTLLLLLLACTTDPTPEPASEPEPAPDVSPPAPTTPATPATPTVWSRENIAGFSPALPSHHAKTPAVLEETPAITQTIARLEAVVDARAGDPGNPWAIAHGLLAQGADWKLTNGEPAVDWLFAEYAETFPVSGRAYVRFPEARGDVRIEPHAEMILKVLTEIGVSPDHSVMVGGEPYTVADLYRGSLLNNYLQPERNHSSFHSTDDMAWALQGLAAWAPSKMVWVAADGTPMALDSFTNFNVAVLHKEMEDVAQAMKTGGTFERNGQGIFRYTCGGAHLLQGAGFAVARGFGDEKITPIFAQQIDLAYYRYGRELKIYNDAMQRYGEEYMTQLVVQQLKFTGHFLESMHKLAAMGLYTPSPAQKKVLEDAATRVALNVDRLHRMGIYDNLDALRAKNEQLYLDVIGDSAHALHGLKIALGQDVVRY